MRACQPKDSERRVEERGGGGWGGRGAAVWRGRERAQACGRERESVRKRFGSSFCFFFHLGLPYANWAWPGVLFVLPEVFTLVLGPCFLATAILDSFSLFYLPNKSKHSKKLCTYSYGK